MNSSKKMILLACLLNGMSLTSCMSVKSYQKMYVNDKAMQLAEQKLVVFETNFESYREGAAGANGGKVGGGCGCN
jgi:hypothetical protein